MEFNGRMDSTIHERLRDLPAFPLIKNLIGSASLDLTNVRYQSETIQSIHSKHSPFNNEILGEEDCARLLAEYEHENRMLDISMNEYRLGMYVEEMLNARP